MKEVTGPFRTVEKLSPRLDASDSETAKRVWLNSVHPAVPQPAVPAWGGAARRWFSSLC